MNKTTIDVPAGIRYISEWEGFNLPNFPVIINKQITGCGFTEWCIRNNYNVILCSPRRILLENKEGQHKGEVMYVRNDLDNVIDIDKDLNRDDKTDYLRNNSRSQTDEELKKHINKLRTSVIDYYYNITTTNRSCKFLVTYDSFKHVKDTLVNKLGIDRFNSTFYVVVDEFQSIFTDSRFKSSTEIEFLNFLQDVQNLCFVSATPMMDKYLDMLPEFQNLPYYEMRWETLDPLRIVKPELDAKACKSITPIAINIVQSYLDRRFQKYTYVDNYGNIQEIESRELVIYVNSVKNICDIIKKCELTYSNTNVLCSNTPDNQKKIRKAFGLARYEEGGIGEVPKKGDPHKMFTLCTRTVYLGADFYSTCARSLILSDANVDCLAVDITLDLPQIMGRQRLLENPWKNRAELYFKSTIKDETFEQLIERLTLKKRKTEELLLSYESTPTQSAKHTLAEKYQRSAKTENYRDDFVAVNTHGGRDLYPVFNNLAMVSELRAFEIQQIDYKDRLSVINTVSQGAAVVNTDKVTNFLREFSSLTRFTDKMRFLCDEREKFSEEEFNSLLESIDIVFKNYYLTVGPEKIRYLQYKNSVIKSEYDRLLNNQQAKGSLLDRIYLEFLVGNTYSRSYIKSTLKTIYGELGIQSSPKAIDLENYFDIKPVLVTNKITGKRDSYYLILKKKNL